MITQHRIKELLDEIDYNRKNCFLSDKTELLMQIAEAALTAKPVGIIRIEMDWNTHRNVATLDMREDLVAADMSTGDKLYTTPPVAALRLPDEKSTDIDYAYYPLTKARHEGWNACLAEVKRLNATVPGGGDDEK